MRAGAHRARARGPRPGVHVSRRSRSRARARVALRAGRRVCAAHGRYGLGEVDLAAPCQARDRAGGRARGRRPRLRRRRPVLLAGGVCRRGGLRVPKPRQPDCVRHRLARDGLRPREPRRSRRRDAPARGRDLQFLWHGPMVPCADLRALRRPAADACPRGDARYATAAAFARRADEHARPHSREGLSWPALPREPRARHHRRGGHARAADYGRVRHLRVRGGGGACARGGAVCARKSEAARGAARAPGAGRCRRRRRAGGVATLRPRRRLGAPRP